MLLQHPAFHDIQQEVPDDKVADWEALGWVRAADTTPPVQEDAAPASKIKGNGSTGDDKAPAEEQYGS